MGLIQKDLITVEYSPPVAKLFADFNVAFIQHRDNVDCLHWFRTARRRDLLSLVPEHSAQGAIAVLPLPQPTAAHIDRGYDTERCREVDSCLSLHGLQLKMKAVVIDKIKHPGTEYLIAALHEPDTLLRYDRNLMDPRGSFYDSWLARYRKWRVNE